VGPGAPPHRRAEGVSVLARAPYDAPAGHRREHARSTELRGALTCRHARRPEAHPASR
jgi:hypothetical protein